MKRLFGILTMVLLSGVLCAPSVLADKVKPGKKPYVSEVTNFAAGEVCAFPVRIEAVTSKQTIQTYADGHTRISGPLTERVTNVATGKSKDLKGTGSLVTRTLANGDQRIVVRGRWIIYLFARDKGGPALLRVNGRLSELLDKSKDAITSFRLRGTKKDLCAQLT
jgi:hypothetical protein